jgi:hypothetical protein
MQMSKKFTWKVKMISHKYLLVKFDGFGRKRASGNYGLRFNYVDMVLLYVVKYVMVE